MKEETKTLVLAILIIVAILLVVANVDSITGSFIKTRSSTRVIFDDDVLIAGEHIRFNVIPGRAGVHNKYRICSDNDLCHVRSYIRCGSFKCKSPVEESYKTRSDWEAGVYYIKLFDYELDDFTKYYFTIN